MKKTIMLFILAVAIGALYGKIVFNQYDKEIEKVFQQTEKIYVLQQGVYSQLENVEKNTSKLDNYVVEKDEPYFRVYVAMTKNNANVNKMKEIFIKAGNDIYVREVTMNNKAFLDILGQYDLLLNRTNDKDLILQIQSQVLNKYKELVLKNE
jgi:hypothetical protein